MASTKQVEQSASAVTEGVPEAPLEVDYRTAAPPAWIRELIETHLAIEAEDAKSAGALGFMARALVLATMPYRDPKKDVFHRANGDFRLRIVAGYEGGIPYGIYPRLLVSWVATEAVRCQSPEIELGENLSAFLRDVLGLGATGGKRGNIRRVSEQMKRLFGSLITAQYDSTTPTQRGFVLRNVMLAEELQLNEDEFGANLWTPQHPNEAGQWNSKVRLSSGFFNECIDHPVPIDLRAYKGLRGSALSMDIYAWLTFRMSYVQRRQRPIPYEALQAQFGAGYDMSPQGRRDFKKAFLKSLRAVQVVYPDVNLDATDRGLVLMPSRPHVLPAQKSLL